MKKLFFIILIFAVILAAGCINGNGLIPEESEENGLIKNPEVTTADLKTACEKIKENIPEYAHSALYEAQYDFCIAIVGEDCSALESRYSMYSNEACLDTLAILNGEYEKCTGEKCFQKSAFLTGDKKHCAKIQSNYARDICYVNVAQNTKDIFVCNELRSSSQVNACNFLIQTYFIEDITESKCMNIGDVEGPFCFAELAFRENKPEYCRLARGAPLNPTGENECYARIAAEYSNSTVCSFFASEPSFEEDVRLSKESCYANSALRKNVCDENIERGLYHHRCYINVALKTGDINVCGEIDYLDDRINCYLNFVLENI